MFEYLRFYSKGFPLWCNDFSVLLHDGFIDDVRPEQVALPNKSL